MWRYHEILSRMSSAGTTKTPANEKNNSTVGKIKVVYFKDAAFNRI